MARKIAHSPPSVPYPVRQRGVSVQLLSDLENGRRAVGLDKALMVARQLGLAILTVPKSELPQTLSRIQREQP